MSAVQLDIFDQLEEPAPVVTCPHCGHSWTQGAKTVDEWLEIHTRRTGGTYDEMPGDCIGQRTALAWLLARAAPSHVNYRGDLLSALIDVRQKGVAKTAVLGVLALAEKRMGKT